MILSIRGLSKVRPLEGAAGYRLVVPELDVRSGEKIVITGPSGSGKSTFLDLLGMVLKPDSAERFLFSPADTTVHAPNNEALLDAALSAAATLPDPLESSLAATTPHARAWDIAGAWSGNRLEDLARWRRKVGYVLQTGGLLPFLTVRENIATPRRLLDLPADGSLDTLVEGLGITHLLDKNPAHISVGERQRAAIARALAARPALVLADEPTAALDPLNAASVLGLFSDMVSALGVTLILVTHAPEQMIGMGFRRLEVRQNITLEQGREAILREGGSL